MHLLGESVPHALGTGEKLPVRGEGGQRPHLPTITQRLFTADHSAQWCSSSCSCAISWPRLPWSGAGWRLSGGTDTRATSPSSNDTARTEQQPLRGQRPPWSPSSLGKPKCLMRMPETVSTSLSSHRLGKSDLPDRGRLSSRRGQQGRLRPHSPGSSSTFSKGMSSSR